MKVIINFKPTNEKIEEFQVIRILQSEDVFIDLPAAVADFGREYETPVLFGSYKGLPVVVEKVELEEQLTHLELHHFKVEESGKLMKTTKEESDLSARLPKGTNTDQLLIDNGQIVWAKPETEEVEDHGDN